MSLDDAFEAAVAGDLRRWYAEELVPDHGEAAARAILRDEVLYRPEGDQAARLREELHDLIGPVSEEELDRRREDWRRLSEQGRL